MFYVNTILTTEEFDAWLSSLQDLAARANILARIGRARLGNFGDIKPINAGVIEMRVDFGPGYRVYFAREGRTVYLLLNGGDKSSQKQDVKRAIALWMALKERQ